MRGVRAERGEGGIGKPIPPKDGLRRRGSADCWEVLEGFGMVVKVLEGLGRFRKVSEAFGRFRKVSGGRRVPEGPLTNPI